MPAKPTNRLRGSVRGFRFLCAALQKNWSGSLQYLHGVSGSHSNRFKFHCRLADLEKFGFWFLSRPRKSAFGICAGIVTHPVRALRYCRSFAAVLSQISQSVAVTLDLCDALQTQRRQELPVPRLSPEDGAVWVEVTH